MPGQPHRSRRSRGPLARVATLLAALLIAVGGVAFTAAAHPEGPVEVSEGALSWGANDTGQLGDGTTDERALPGDVELPEGVTFTQVDAGTSHTLALASDGTVWAWGSNQGGQLGNGTAEDSATPVQVPIPDGVAITQIAAGSDHSLAIASDGRVFGWGLNFFGQVGDGSDAIQVPTPVEVLLPDGVEVTSVSGGRIHSLAVTSTGSVLAWGENTGGQLGNGTGEDSSTPVTVSLPDGVTAAQATTRHDHSLVLTADGDVLAWGTNDRGQLGDGTTDTRTTPVPVDTGGRVVTQVAAGVDFSLVLTNRQATTTTLTADPSEVTAGEEVTLTATVDCPGGTPTGEVTFHDGDTELGTGTLDDSGVATLTTSEPAVGEHRITAQYPGDENCTASTSEPATMTVNEEPPTTTTEPPTTTQPTTNPGPPRPTEPTATTSGLGPVQPIAPGPQDPGGSGPDATPQEPLAKTGVPAGAVAAAGLALRAAGLTLVLWTRRRRAG